MEKDLDYGSDAPWSERFSAYLPDLDDIGGLELNQHHFLTVEEPGTFPNLGVRGLYSIGETGHDYLVHCILPGVEPERYPIAIFGEEEGVAKVIASSIRSWFPSVLVYKIHELLSRYWSFVKSGSGKAASSCVESLDNILEHRGRITEICGAFENPGFVAVLDELFAAARTRDPNAWRYYEFYRAAECDSPLGRFFELKQRAASEAEYLELIRTSPNCNVALFDRMLSGEARDSRYRFVRQETRLAPDIALEVFSRRLTLDFGSTSDTPKVLSIAAKSCFGAVDQQSPYLELVNTLAEHNGNCADLCLAQAFFELGTRLKDEEVFRQAAIAYENAVFLMCVESEEFYSDAFSGLLETAEMLGDEEYQRYLGEYRQGIPNDG